MATFSKKSLKILETCHPDIQKVMHEAIKYVDFSVLYGTRTASEQFELYKVGRKFVSGKWIVVGKTVTNLDGNIKKSNHNYSPSKAIDVAPYPIDWSDIQGFKDLGVVIKEACKTVGVNLQWGGDWKSFVDYPHWEVKER